MGLFYNVRKPRKFNHQPIFFDPNKEQLDERVERVKREMGLAGEESYKPNIKGAFIDQTTHVVKKQEAEERGSGSKSTKLIIGLVLLLLLFYFLYMNN